jgi:hypothetical protein
LKITNLIFGKKHGKLAHEPNLAPKIIHDDILPTKLTFGVEGSRTTMRDIEGEVWQ